MTMSQVIKQKGKSQKRGNKKPEDAKITKKENIT